MLQRHLFKFARRNNAEDFLSGAPGASLRIRMGPESRRVTVLGNAWPRESSNDRTQEVEKGWLETLDGNWSRQIDFLQIVLYLIIFNGLIYI